jgi:general stress protein CsbA
MGKPTSVPTVTDLDTILGFRFAAGEIVRAIRQMFSQPLLILFLVVLFRVVFRNSWAAVGVLVAIMTAESVLGAQDYLWLIGGAELIIWSMIGYVLIRFGLIPIIVMYTIIQELSNSQPFTLDFSTWYAGSSIFALLAAVVLLGYGFYVSLGGQALFDDA